MSAVTIVYTSLGPAGRSTLAMCISPSARPMSLTCLRSLGSSPGWSVKDGLVKFLSIKVWEGGFAAVPDGLQYMREGKVSAEKIEYRV